jgi:hypothetical protein
MYLTKLYLKYHIYINDYKLLKILQNVYYSNYSIYFIGDQQNDHKHNIEYITMQHSFEETCFYHIKTLPPNEYIVFFDSSIKEISENLLLEFNHLFLKHKCNILNHEKTSIWSCKSGIIQNLLKNTTLTKQNLLSECLKICNEHKTVNLFKNLISNIRIDPSQRDEVQICFQKNDAEIIHIILATYERNKNIELVFNMLKKQTYKYFHVHLLDNNTNNELQKELDDILKNFQDLTITLHRKNENSHCFGRILCVQEILQKHMMDYVIIFDDDQIYHTKWLKEMIEQKRSLCTLSWYGKIFEECDYWKTSLTYKQLEKKQRPEITEFHYFGPGGSILDINLFLLNELYDYEKYSKDIKAIDDIWMSFIFKKFLNIPFIRKFEHPIRCIDWKDKSKMTWANIKNEKSILFKQLSQNYDWDVTKKSFKTYHMNDVFEKVYVFYNKKDDLKQINAKFQKYNICFQFLPFDNNKDEIIQRKINEKKHKSILFFDANYEFDNFVLYKFDSFMKSITNTWTIMHLGKEFIINEPHNKSKTYGINNLI